MLSPLLIIIRVWHNINYGSSQSTITIAKSGNSHLGRNHNQGGTRGVNSPTPLWVLVSEAERGDLPEGPGKEQYETNIVDSDEQRALL